jgi:hypothetical protein
MTPGTVQLRLVLLTALTTCPISVDPLTDSLGTHSYFKVDQIADDAGVHA